MTRPNDPKTILVVDDDIDFLDQQKLLLETAGYQVLTAEGRRPAERLLDGRRPDLAVIDLMMEEMDGGFTLCYHIKRKDPTIPIIVVTGVTRETGIEFDVTTAEERSWVKADVMLAKPIRFEQLKTEIERLLGSPSHDNAPAHGRG
jgi:CheY-like chemotaxis protein